MPKKKKDGDVGFEVSIDWDALSEAGKDIFEELKPVEYWIDTGNLALNHLCSGKFVGGGIPGGRITEILGESSTGKTLLGVNILTGIQRMGGIPVLLDAEHTFNPDFSRKVSKFDPDRMFTISSDTLEGCFNKIYAAVRVLREKTPLSVPIAILYDSIAASPSDREFAETTIDMESSSGAAIKAAGAGKDQPGERAKTCSKHFRNLPKFLSDNNAALIIINQFRSAIGVMFGDDRVGSGGGKALEYYASLRMTLRRAKVTKDKFDVVNGVNLNVKCIKNKVQQPFMSIHTMHLLFKKGINPFGALLEPLITSERIIQKTAGNYEIAPEYSDGEVVKFKASKERNNIEPDLLLKYPKLVDATSPDQIQYYLNMYQGAIDATNNEIASEDDIEED